MNAMRVRKCDGCGQWRSHRSGEQVCFVCVQEQAMDPHKRMAKLVKGLPAATVWRQIVEHPDLLGLIEHTHTMYEI